MDNPIGIYEKALPGDLDWPGRLAAAKEAGYEFVEMSVDESDARLARLDWSQKERMELHRAVVESGVRIPSMCLSGHQRFPFGSRDEAVRGRAREIMDKAIDLCLDLGIRNIQLAGYDVYYEEHDQGTEERFLEGMQWSVDRAASRQVMLSMEIMDTAFMNSISKWKWWEQRIRSPWFTVYPDIGNLTAWNNDVAKELDIGIDRERGLVVIKPSGVDYASMAPDDLVVTDMHGAIVEGSKRPSSDLPTHLVLYREWPEIGGVVHTHSAYGTAFAQAGQAIPCYGTTHADYCPGPIPCIPALTKAEVEADYEGNTGASIVKHYRTHTLKPLEYPGAVLACHGPFAWGKSVGAAVESAVILENVAKMALFTVQIAPQASVILQYILGRHHLRKHGPNAYYGQ